MTDSKDHTATREALDSLLSEIETAMPTDTQRWAVYGYIYGLDHAGVLSKAQFVSALERLGITGDDASRADVAL